MPISKYEKILSRVKRPARYVYKEVNTPAIKKDSKLRICLAFPDTYEIGMSYVGFHILYGILKRMNEVDVERAYAPWVDMEREMLSMNLKLASAESSRPLHEFDVVGFTLQYEMTFTNILSMLNLGGIEILAENREDSSPIVIAGGPCALSPEPMSRFIDAFLIGDGEELLPEVLLALKEGKGSSRKERLALISKIAGVYVPSFSTYSTTEDGVMIPCYSGCSPFPIKRRRIESIEDAFYPSVIQMPNTEPVHDRAPIEIFRGCSRGCRFCQAGMIYRPVRYRSIENITNIAESLIRSTGHETLGLISLSTCDYPEVDRLIASLKERLNPLRTNISLPSLRIDSFSVELAHALRSEENKSALTFAPEAGSQRLRNVINKGLDDAEIIRVLDDVFRYGWDKVKLYFMIGLPTETDSDLDGIIKLAKEARKVARAHKRKGDINVSLSPFVPKSHTPFQWCGRPSSPEMEDKGRRVKYNVRDPRIEVSYHDVNLSLLEAVMARGDASVGRLIESAWRKGARFDGWGDTFDFEIWKSSAETEGINLEAIANRERKIDESLPFDHIDSGVARSFLLKEHDAAILGDLTSDCRTAGCNLCGVADPTSCSTRKGAA